MKTEFKQYISKRYGVSIPNLYKNSILIGQIIDVDTTELLDSLTELDVLLRIKPYTSKIDIMDLEWLTEIQKEKLSMFMNNKSREICITTIK